MGREALVHVKVISTAHNKPNVEVGELKVLLESRELILRGTMKRTYQKSAITDVHVDDEFLNLVCGTDRVELHLGNKQALSWAKALATAPPSLRDKLGVGPNTYAYVLGDCAENAGTELTEALHGAVTSTPGEAALFIALVFTPQDLVAALRAHAAHSDVPMWTIYAKGPKAVFGDTAIRVAMRDAGFIDTKSCAVSAALTATRYGLRKKT